VSVLVVGGVCYRMFFYGVWFVFFSFFFVLFVFIDRVVEEFWPLFWCGLVLKTRKGMVLLTRKGMVTNVLNSFLDRVLTRMFEISLCLAWLF
jgi:hypothetical protein